MLEPRDWPLYRDLRLRALADAPDAFSRAYDAEAIQPDEYWMERLRFDPSRDLPLVAESGAAPVGLAWGRVDPSTPSSAGLFQLWVAPTHRSCGIGRRMVGEVVAWAKGVGAEVLWLFVTSGDTPAARLYRAAGFAPTGETRPLRTGSEITMRRMHLDLRAGS